MTDEPKRPALDVRKFDDAMGKAVSLANQANQHKEPLSNSPPEYRFVQLTDQVCEAMIEAARHQLAIAESNMKATEQQAEKMRADAKRRWDEHDAYVRGLEDFGMNLLEANKKFQKLNGR